MQVEAISKNYSVEIACVILCCRIFVKTTPAAELEQFVQSHEIDWEEVYRLAALHRVRPIVYRVLNNNRIPGPALTRFRNYCHALSVFAFERQIESARILQVLREQGIAVKMYKGLDFTRVVYGGDISMREFTDMDFIVDNRQLAALVDVMLSQGYESPSLEYFRRFPTSFFDNRKDITFYKRSPGGRLFSVEFHYRPDSFINRQLSFKEFLGDDYLDSTQPITSQQYYQLMLINHGVRDYYPNLRSLVDMVMLISAGHKQVPEQLQRHECLARLLTNQLMNCAAQPVATGYDGSLTKTARIIINYLLTTSTRSLRDQIYTSVCLNRYSISKFRLLVRFTHFILLPNESDFMTARLPYFQLYYFTKPYRVIKKIFLNS
ncbi:nucleotidyltransferase family protein [Chitinophaga sp.]|uniref:nucleotidyltransferase family protein n=1 Tax=Chitinophaga sp. TaxID=1869181 RepID=UPI0031D1C48F